MADIQHRDIIEGNIHSLANWKFETASDRLNAPVEETDLGKIAHQTNNNTLWWLINTTPTWKKVLVEGDSALPIGQAGGGLQGAYPNPVVRSDSHTHTNETLPPYPTTLPPTGNAGGDLQGTYPNPSLKPIGVTAGEYLRPIITVNNKGLVTSISSGPPPESGLADVTTPPYNSDDNTVATTKYVTQGGLYSSTLNQGEDLLINPGYVKQVHKMYSIKGKLVLAGNLYITDDEQTDLKPMHSRKDEVITEDFYKLVISGYSLKEDSRLIINGVFKII